MILQKSVNFYTKRFNRLSNDVRETIVLIRKFRLNVQSIYVDAEDDG